MAIVNVSTLVEKLRENQLIYQKIYGEKFAQLQAAKRDLNMLPLAESEEVVLMRSFVSNISQPGKTGAMNYISSISNIKQRIGKLRPFKADIKFDELELVNIQKNFIGVREPGDPRDIHSLPGRSFLMGQIMNKFEGEVARGFYKAIENPATGVVGGLNLYDGFEHLFVEGYADVADGGVKDIPDENIVNGAAVTITQANVIQELRKFVDTIMAAPSLEEFYFDDASIFIDPRVLTLLSRAQEDSVANKDAVATKGADGQWRLNDLPNVVFKERMWMLGTETMFFTIDGNLFYLYEDEVESDGPSIKFQESDRDLKIMIDANGGLNYADGRLICLYKLAE
jgi:hypothetical protein